VVGEILSGKRGGRTLCGVINEASDVLREVWIDRDEELLPLKDVGGGGDSDSSRLTGAVLLQEYDISGVFEICRLTSEIDGMLDSNSPESEFFQSGFASFMVGVGIGSGASSMYDLKVPAFNLPKLCTLLNFGNSFLVVVATDVCTEALFRNTSKNPPCLTFDECKVTSSGVEVLSRRKGRRKGITPFVVLGESSSVPAFPALSLSCETLTLVDPSISVFGISIPNPIIASVSWVDAGRLDS